MVSQIREVIDLVVDNEMEVVDIDDNDDEVEAVDIADDNDLQIVDIAVDGDDEIDVDNANYDDEVEVIARDAIVLLEIDELDSDIEQADSAYGGGSDDEYHDVREDLLDLRQLNRLNREAVYCVNYIYFTENHRSKYCVSCYFDVRDMFEGLRKRCGHYSERFIAMRGIFCTNCGGPLHQIVTRDMCPTCLNVYRADYDYVSLHTQRTGGDKSVELPDGWIIPETVNRSYRDPRDLSRFGMFSGGRKIFKSHSNLGRDKNEILRITVGNSEYADVIGSTGDRILKEQLHGIPTPLDPPSFRLKAPDIISSRCYSMGRGTPFISNVF